MNHGALARWSRRGHRRVRGCMCYQRPETALAYALQVWSAMADKVRFGGGQRKTGRGLTVGVVEEGIAVR